MNSHGLTKENLVATLPVALQKDPSAVALAEAMADLLARRPGEIDQLRIYPAIDTLDEPLLDILAYDFKVDWWDADYGLEEKRRTLKTSWQVHKTLGTKGAVEKATSAVYPISKVQEWFEYGGKPYHFQMSVDLPEDEWTPERHKQLMWRLQYYKNLRSHLDFVVYHMQPVVLENRQAFWFAAMYISLRAQDKNRLVQNVFRAAFKARQVLGSALCLRVSSKVTAQLAGTLGLFIHAWANNFGRGPVRFNGRRLMDGTVLFDQQDIPGPALVRVTIETKAVNTTWESNFGPGPVRFDGQRYMDGMVRFNQWEIPSPSLAKVTIGGGAVNRLSVSGWLAGDTWKLDGTFRLDGMQTLCAERSEL